MRKILIVLVLLGGAATFLGYRWINEAYTAEGPLTAPSRVEILQGASVRGVVAQLGKQGVIRDARGVSWYLRINGLKPKVKAGTYEFPAQASPRKIFDMLERGVVVLE